MTPLSRVAHSEMCVGDLLSITWNCSWWNHSFFSNFDFIMSVIVHDSYCATTCEKFCSRRKIIVFNANNVYIIYVLQFCNRYLFCLLFSLTLNFWYVWKLSTYRKIKRDPLSRYVKIAVELAELVLFLMYPTNLSLSDLS